jgi:hypothetical protein
MTCRGFGAWCSTKISVENSYDVSELLRCGLLTVHMLVICRFGPFYVEPVVAGLTKPSEGSKPFIAGTDLIGCLTLPKDFIVSGTASDQLFGMAESLWEPDLVRTPNLLSPKGGNERRCLFLGPGGSFRNNLTDIDERSRSGRVLRVGSHRPCHVSPCLVSFRPEASDGHYVIASGAQTPLVSVAQVGISDHLIVLHQQNA